MPRVGRGRARKASGRITDDIQAHLPVPPPKKTGAGYPYVAEADGFGRYVRRGDQKARCWPERMSSIV